MSEITRVAGAHRQTAEAALAAAPAGWATCGSTVAVSAGTAAGGQQAARPGLRCLGQLLPLLLALLGWPGWLAAQELQPVPALTTPVTDQVGLLSANEAAALNERLLALDHETGSQMAVLIVPSTAPEDIFSYSFRVADTWKLGRKGVDDGALLVVATQDRKYYLQVGYGLEGAIPDARAKQILDDIMRPHFQRGDFAGGINAAVTAVTSLIQGEGLPPPQARTASRSGDSRAGGGIFLAIIAGLVASFIGRAIFGRFLGGLAGGGVAFALALVLGAAVGVAVFAAVFAMLAASGRGVFIPGGFGGGGFGRGGFGGGGFGGGGGGFGGGGAGGSW